MEGNASPFLDSRVCSLMPPERSVAQADRVLSLAQLMTTGWLVSEFLRASQLPHMRTEGAPELLSREQRVYVSTFRNVTGLILRLHTR